MFWNSQCVLFAPQDLYILAPGKLEVKFISIHWQKSLTFFKSVPAVLRAYKIFPTLKCTPSAFHQSILFDCMLSKVQTFNHVKYVDYASL